MNSPQSGQPVLEDLPRYCQNGVLFASFDTSYKMSWWLIHFTAAKPPARELKKLGGHQLESQETIHVTDREGPLYYTCELELAEQWLKL